MIKLDLSATPFAPLSAHLMDLLHELDGQNVPLIVVGGYSLFLRRLIVEQTGSRSLYAFIPPVRATEDFDIVLKLELLADPVRVLHLAAAIERLGYDVLKDAARYQFCKPGTAWEGHRDVKIDLLARQPGPADPQLPYDERRIFPKGKKKGNPLHARCTPEAIAAEDGLTEVALAGQRTSMEAYEGTVFLPSPYAIYLMKLFAFRDEETGKKRGERELYARKHALDLYTLTSLLTEVEYDNLQAYRERYGSHPAAQDASSIVAEFFSRPDSKGALRIQEHPDFPGTSELDDFLALLAEIFPP